MEKGPKGIAAMLISKAKPEMEDEESGSEGMDVAVEEIMRALDEKDPEMLKEALNAFLDCR